MMYAVNRVAREIKEIRERYKLSNLREYKVDFSEKIRVGGREVKISFYRVYTDSKSLKCKGDWAGVGWVEGYPVMLPVFAKIQFRPPKKEIICVYDISVDRRPLITYLFTLALRGKLKEKGMGILHLGHGDEVIILDRRNEEIGRLKIFKDDRMVSPCEIRDKLEKILFNGFFNELP